MRHLLIALASLLLGGMATATAQPKFGPDAAPLFENLDYFRRAPATDYWLVSTFLAEQQTASGSSAAAAATTVNALLGVPRQANDRIITPRALVQQVANQKWLSDIAPSGGGVRAVEFGTYLRESLNAVGLETATVAATTPADAGQASLEEFRAALAANEASPRDVMLVYYDRGVVTGSNSGAHISPIGAYDQANDLVLIMDVEQDLFVPYWTSATTLLVALVRPIASGPLAGQRGGYFLVAHPP